MTKYLSRIAGLLIAATCLSASAQDAYPKGPIHWIVPNPAGGGVDASVRTLAQVLSPSLGQPLVIENRPGAATMIGATAVAHGKADGHLWLTGDTATFATNPHLYKKMMYDPFKDFSYVSMTGRFHMVLVAKKSFPANTVEELIQYAKANPGKVNYATPGTGLPHHLAMELFMQQTGINMHHIPYKGAPNALQDMISGEIDVMFVDSVSGASFIKDGRVKAYAIASAKRFEGQPDIPTFAEIGIKNFEAYAWQGVVVPAGTPAPVIKRMNQELVKALSTPALRKRMIEIGLEPLSSTPEEFVAYARSESERWGKLITAKGLRVD